MSLQTTTQTCENALVSICVSFGMIWIRLRVGRAAQEAVKDNMCAILKVSNPEYNCDRLLGSAGSSTTQVSGRNQSRMWMQRHASQQTILQAEWDFLKAAGQLRRSGTCPPRKYHRGLPLLAGTAIGAVVKGKTVDMGSLAGLAQRNRAVSQSRSVVRSISDQGR